MGDTRNVSLNEPEGMRARVRDHRVISPATTCIAGIVKELAQFKPAAGERRH